VGHRPPLAPAPLLVLALGTGGLGCDAAIERELLRRWDQPDLEMLEDGDLHVVLVGTGLPIPDPERLPASTAIAVEGELLLVDAGAGTIRQADLLEVPIHRLTTVLVTHFHSDHMGGLGEALASSWFRGRENRVRIYGPPGLEQVVAGFLRAYAFDTQHRTLPGADELDPRWREPEVHPVALEGEEAAVVFERGDLRVSAFAVDHSPIAPAYGYRIDYRGRSVVLSGDTRAYPPLARHARDADLLIHSAGGPEDIPERVVEVLTRLQREGKLPRVDLDLFPTPVEVAEIAAAARVDTLVFSHILPVNNFLARWFWLRGVDEVYAGEVVVGKDGMRFDLEVSSAAEKDGHGG